MREASLHDEFAFRIGMFIIRPGSNFFLVVIQPLTVINFGYYVFSRNLKKNNYIFLTCRK